MLSRHPLTLAGLVVPTALLLYAGLPSHTPARRSTKPAVSTNNFAHTVAPVLTKYCVGCHSGDKPAGGVSLASAKTDADVLKAQDAWERVSKNIGAATMPPAGSPAPTQVERDQVSHWLDTTLGQAQCQLNDPGRVTMRRLNRIEYNNTIRDLLGVDVRPGDDFPNDDVGYGFDNVGDVLSLSPLLMEKYLDAAEKVAKAAILTPEDMAHPVRFAAADLPGASKTRFHSFTGHLQSSEGEIGTSFDAARAGDYTLHVRAFGQQAGPDPVRMAIKVDGKPVHEVDVKAIESAPEVYTLTLPLTAGKHQLAVAFVNDFYNAEAPVGQRDRNLAVDYLEVQPPAGLPATLPPSHRRIFVVTPHGGNDLACARKIMTAFAQRAYRRPPTPAEVDRLVSYVRMSQKEGESFERGIQLAVEAALVSPNFLFRVETDTTPVSTASVRRGGVRTASAKGSAGVVKSGYVGDYALASRLSYFLWSSMPDDTLTALAAKGTLHNPDVLAAQAKRMLQNPKANALAQNFAGQWLQLRKLNTVAPDPSRFPDWNDGLRTAMRTETEMFFASVMHENSSILDFLDGRYTFVNAALAKHYGMAGVDGDSFRRVALTDGVRGGVLTQASVLTVTSNPTRTSPVKRGKWVLEQFLNQPPPPPPPGVGDLPDDKKGPLLGTLRQRMEQHRANPACASCHARMDPLGFGLENFDPTGSWRTKDGQYPVDASGVLPDGKKFEGPAALRAILLTRKAEFTRCLAEKMLTYALGRGVERYDKCHVDDIAQTVAKKDYKFDSLIVAIVQSDPFRKRRGSDPTPPNSGTIKQTASSK